MKAEKADVMLTKCTRLSPALLAAVSYYDGLLCYPSHRYSLAQTEEKRTTGNISPKVVLVSSTE